MSRRKRHEEKKQIKVAIEAADELPSEKKTRSDSFFS